MEARANRAEVKLVSHRQQRSLSRDCRGDVAGAREVAEGGEVMDWPTALFVAFVLGLPLAGCTYYGFIVAREVVFNAWEARFNEGYELGKCHGESSARIDAAMQGFAVCGFMGHDFAWKTRDEIADEVIAERAKQRQEHVRQQMACACDRVERWSEKND
jgi:hypothetical protein